MFRITKSVLVSLTLVVLFLGLAARAHADQLILETATLGPVDQGSGVSITGSQFIGARFTLTAMTQITQIGGHFYGIAEGGIFGAIVQTSGPSLLPAGNPFDPDVVLAATTFRLPSPSADILTPLNVTLGPGTYAVIFGTGLFEAMGTGAAPQNNPQLPAASFVIWSSVIGWRDADFLTNIRFVVRGQPVRSFTTIDFPGARLTIANSINNAGDIVGFYNDAAGVGHGYLLIGGQFFSIDIPGATLTNAVGNNNARAIVGFYNDAAGVGHGYLLSGGQFATIDFPGATFTSAGGINDAGDIVGSYNDAAGTSHGFLLSGGQFTSFDFPGAGQTFAGGINADGYIVGTYQDSTTASHAYLLISGEFTPIDFPGAEQTTATKINAAGDIVGLTSDSAGIHGYLLSGGQFTSFDFPGVFLTAANGINDAGGIVGTYQGAGVFHGFLLE